MNPIHRSSWILLLFCVTACGDSSTGPTTGTLTVTVTSTGDDLDPDGYTLTVNTDERAVDVTGSVTYTDLTAGVKSVSLGGVSDNCAATPTGPQSVTVIAGGTVTVTFVILCDAILEEMTLVAADRTGNIYVVDESTGLETFSFAPETDDGVGGTEMLGVISSMAYVPWTDAWWFGLGGNSVCTLSGRVYVLDRDTGSPTAGQAIFRGETGTYAVSGLAVDVEAEKIYTLESDGGGTLVELDSETADTTIILTGLSEGSSGKGTTFSGGLLYVAGDDMLTEIDIGAGKDTLVANFTFAKASQTIGSMATRPSDGMVFAIVKDGGGVNGTTVTYATGMVTNVGANTNPLDGLTYIPTAWLN